MRILLSSLFICFASQSAYAGKCDAYIDQIANQTGERLIYTFKKTFQCDKAVAEDQFPKFIKAAASSEKNIETIVSLSLAAIKLKAYLPVWNMLGGFKEYSVRDQVASEIGQKCSDEVEIVSFLQGAYFGLDPVPFSQWDDALITCQSDDLVAWMESVVVAPPKSSYDEKYNTMITTYVKRKHADALPALEKAAVACATRSGPFNNILEKMNQAVEPLDFGEDISPENRARLKDALVIVANAAPPEKASSVADRLYDSGATEAAASLLPRVYPDRVQDGDRLLYGAASIETCDKQTFIHWASVSEPAKRWSIISDVEAPLRQFKPRLKCTPEGEWPVLATNEPVKDKSQINSWAKGLVEEWESKGFEVKDKEEKTISLN
jgi:hypothetical protein